MQTWRVDLTQLCAALVLSGTWRLPPRQAMTLQPLLPGVLQVAQGRIWVTGDGPHSGPANDLGDRVLGVGDQLVLATGQRLVIEALDARAPASFSWDPAPQAAGAAEGRLWPVAQAWCDLRLALGLGLRAAGRLARGWAGLLWGRAERPGAGSGMAV